MMRLMPKQVHEEDGLSTTLVIITLMFGALALMLVLIPYVSNFTARRVAQNGADAAAHASAIEFSEDLSIRFGAAKWVPYVELSDAACSTDPFWMDLPDIRDKAHERSVDIYRAEVAICSTTGVCPLSWAGGFENQARQYATSNNTQLQDFGTQLTFWHPNFNYYHERTEKTLCPVLANADVTHRFPTWTGTEFESPGYATGIAYITDMDTFIDLPFPHPTIMDPVLSAISCIFGCTKVPCITWTVMYDYEWENNLTQRNPSITTGVELANTGSDQAICIN